MGAKEIFGALAQLDGSSNRDDRQRNALNLLELSLRQEERLAKREIADYSQDVKELSNFFTQYKTELADPSLSEEELSAVKTSFNEGVAIQRDKYGATADSDLANFFNMNVSGVNEMFQTVERGQSLQKDVMETYNNAQDLYKEDVHSGRYNPHDADAILENISTLQETATKIGY